MMQSSEKYGEFGSFEDIQDRLEKLENLLKRRNIPCADLLIAYFDNLDSQIQRLGTLLLEQSLEDKLQDYALDNATQDFILLNIERIDMKLGIVHDVLINSVEELNISYSGFNNFDEAPYLQLARQSLDKFERKEKHHEDLMRKARRRITKKHQKLTP